MKRARALATQASPCTSSRASASTSANCANCGGSADGAWSQNWFLPVKVERSGSSESDISHRALAVELGNEISGFKNRASRLFLPVVRATFGPAAKGKETVIKLRSAHRCAHSCVAQVRRGLVCLGGDGHPPVVRATFGAVSILQICLRAARATPMRVTTRDGEGELSQMEGDMRTARTQQAPRKMLLSSRHPSRTTRPRVIHCSKETYVPQSLQL